MGKAGRNDLKGNFGNFLIWGEWGNTCPIRDESLFFRKVGVGKFYGALFCGGGGGGQ